MRIAVTLDDDLAAMLHQEMKRSGETFKQVVNRFMRLGFGLPLPPIAKRSEVRPAVYRGRREKRSRE